jgi:hypothetical protein
MLALPGHAVAQGSSATAIGSAAERLFSEGRALLDEGNLELACTKFEESYQLAPGAMGTLFNLALCNERRGRLATAWIEQQEVLAASRATRPDRVALAEERLRAIAPRVTTLTIVAPHAAETPTLVVTLDGVALPASSWSNLKIDGGQHKVAAAAEGRAIYTEPLDAPVEHGELTVTIPPLERIAIEPRQTPAANTEAAPAAPPAADSSNASAPPGRASSATLGWILGGTGLAAAALGAGFGVSVLAQADDPSKYDALNAQAWVANIAIPLGVVLAGAGAYLVLSSPPAPSVSPAGPPLQGSANGARVGWQGAF